MAIHATLTLDLNGSVTPAARQKFYDSLRSSNLIKSNLTTTWTVRFKEGVSLASAQAYVKQSVQIASTASGVSNYEAGAMYGTAPMVQWNSAVATILGY